MRHKQEIMSIVFGKTSKENTLAVKSKSRTVWILEMCDKNPNKHLEPLEDPFQSCRTFSISVFFSCLFVVIVADDNNGLHIYAVLP